LHVFSCGVQAESEDSALIDLPFEVLLQREVVSADRLARQISDAASAVSIVTAEDIRDFGYRSLSDILDSMRGLSMAHDSSYGFLSGRGYGNPGSYAGKITVLVDGYRAPDNVWNQNYFGNDGILDVDLIERVEFIPGSGSSSYGDAAFLGVVNIITKLGRDINGIRVASEFGSHGWRQQKLIGGKRFDSDLDVVFGISGLNNEGRYLPPEYGLDSTVLYERESNRRLFLKAGYHDWTLETAWSQRYTFDSYFESRYTDRNAFTSLRYDGQLSDRLKLSSHFYFGQYRSIGQAADGWRYANQGGNWWGIDTKLVSTAFDRQTIVLGTEYRNDFKQSQWYQSDPYLPADDRHTRRKTVSLYAYDDIVLNSHWQLNGGARLDARNNDSTTLSPRLALIHTPQAGTVFKASTGIAHLQPSADQELNYGNPEVEHLRASELVWEQALGPRTRLVTALYQYRVTHDAVAIFGNNLVYQNVSVQGMELEFEHKWQNGTRLRASYALQDSEGDGGYPAFNTSKNIAKLNLAVPLVGEQLKLGLGLRYRSGYRNENYSLQPSTVVGDLTLSGRWHGWFFAASIRNAGDLSYQDDGKQYYGDISNFMPYHADRRNYWLQIGYEFK
jgi:iron complex outermembrane receptor protein